MPPAIDEIKQLDGIKLLGIMFQVNVKMDSHTVYFHVLYS